MLKSIFNSIVNIVKWVIAQIEWIKEFFNDNNGKPRVTAILRVLVVIYWLNALSKSVYNTNKIPELSWEWIIFLVLVIGLSNVTDLIALLKARFNMKNNDEIKTNKEA